MFFFVAGDVTISPSEIEIPADQEPVSKWPTFDDDPRAGHQRFVIKYTVTASRIEIGGGIELAFGYPCVDVSNPNLAQNDGYLLGPSSNLALFPIAAFQADTPDAPDYTTVSTNVRGAVLLVDTISRAADDAHALRVRVTRRVLLKGDVINVIFGDTRGGGPGASLSYHPGRPSLVCFEGLDGSGSYALSPDPRPELLVTGGTPASYRVNLPVTVPASMTFAATIEVVQGLDAPDRSLLPVEQYAGIVRVDEVGGGTPSQWIAFDATMRGVARFAWSFGTTGIHRLVATEVEPDGSDCSLVGYRNPIEVRAASAETAIYCGDLHRHSCEGNHASVPDYQAWLTLWNGRQDFGAVLEHTYPAYRGFLHANAVAQQFQHDVDPRETSFVAFPGYEWSQPDHHRHVVFAGFASESAIVDRPYAGAESPPPTQISDVAGLLAALRTDASGPDRFAVPHHSLYDFTKSGQLYDWGPLLDDSAQPVVEIMADHGCSERFLVNPVKPSDYVIHSNIDAQRPSYELASVQDALALGHRFGFVGGSDNHGPVLHMKFLPTSSDSFGETSIYARDGLTFVVGERATGAMRDQIWEGLRKRHTYVTTGARMWIEWTATSGRKHRHSGDDISGYDVTFTLEQFPSAIASSRIPRVARWELWRDGYVLAASADYPAGLDSLDVDIKDPAPPRDGKRHPYYAKVIQDDDHVGWASPIWVKYKKK